MNDQHLQQILTLQQALATAAAAALINSVLNPQQAAAGLTGSLPASAANALLAQPQEPGNDAASQQQQLQQLTQLLAHHQQQQQHQQQESHQRGQPNLSSPQQANDLAGSNNNNRIQDLLLQLQQQASLASSPLGNLNLNHLIAPQSTLPPTGLLPGSPARSPISNGSGGSLRLNAQSDSTNSATTSNIQTNPNLNQISSIKKLKRHHHQQQQHLPSPTHPNSHHQFYRSTEATSKPQPLSASKSQHVNSSSSLSKAGQNSSSSNNSSSSSSTAFLSNNVGLPRKLVRGQDVWLGRGAEQTRQILKCMWCGQSFRTLADMTQHMKITQHYTNIISQEQITSWRQPDQAGSQEAPNLKQQQQNKLSSTQMRNIDDNLDELSDKFHDSDREGSFSNDEDHIDSDIMLGHDDHQRRSASGQSNQSKNRSSVHLKQSLDSVENSNSESAINDESSFTEAIKSPQRANSTSSSMSNNTTTKPLTRSRKRENSGDETTPRKSSQAHHQGRENSPNSSLSPSSRQRQNISGNLILSNLNENPESKETAAAATTASNDIDSDPDAVKTEADSDAAADEDLAIKQVIKKMLDVGGKLNGELEDEDLTKIVAPDRDYANDPVDKLSSKKRKEFEKEEEGKEEEFDEEQGDLTNDHRSKLVDEDAIMKSDIKAEDDEDNNSNDEENQNNRDDELNSESPSDSPLPSVQSAANLLQHHHQLATSKTTTTTSASQKIAPSAAEQKVAGGTGDPLSALETMVEKSFDPRLRPGLATGGILQRLGIDEEVCPPWQHINYANWYAAAAYGHPMAAALLAAGINLQNGTIKLSKNMASQKKSDDD